ncbi:MAG: hypothetical protein AAF721_27450 [Myxococcota bacterium]
MRSALLIGLTLSGCLIAQDRPGSSKDHPNGTPIEGWRDIAMNGDDLCALHLDGSLWCGTRRGLTRLGEESYRALGGLDYGGLCAVRASGTLVCGLHNAVGVAPFEIDGTFVDVTGTRDAGCGLREGGSVRCWPEATSVPGPFSAIGGGDRFACGITHPGDGLVCWSIDSLTFDEALVNVPSGSFEQVVTDRHVGCGLRFDGAIQCWGYDFDDVLPGPPAGSYSRVWLSGGRGCAVSDDGRARCWGGDAGDPNYPELDPPPELEFTTLAVGHGVGCGITQGAGVIECWGEPT